MTSFESAEGVSASSRTAAARGAAAGVRTEWGAMTGCRKRIRRRLNADVTVNRLERWFLATMALSASANSKPLARRTSRTPEITATQASPRLWQPMFVLKTVQWILGMMVSFYLLKGLLGRFEEGDFTKASVAFVGFLGLLSITSGVIRVF